MPVVLFLRPSRKMLRHRLSVATFLLTPTTVQQTIWTASKNSNAKILMKPRLVRHSKIEARKNKKLMPRQKHRHQLLQSNMAHHKTRCQLKKAQNSRLNKTKLQHSGRVMPINQVRHIKMHKKTTNNKSNKEGKTLPKLNKNTKIT